MNQPLTQAQHKAYVQALTLARATGKAHVVTDYRGWPEAVPVDRLEAAAYKGHRPSDILEVVKP